MELLFNVVVLLVVLAVAGCNAWLLSLAFFPDFEMTNEREKENQGEAEATH